ncbi:MAG: cbb3-type cytochrome c oxidase subunit I, partial [Actinobacteria bacterium]|nr:cbb3-type cytochrome c oxidase subunit I [Actinomycetota bacterium]
MATLAEKLDAVWAEKPGIASFISTVDHKRIGFRYFYTGMLFLILGGIEALLIRMQLAGPELDLVTPEAFNQLFSMHGITMMFLFAMPVLSGFGNYFVPLMIGARDMAFPRLNAFGYWVFLAGGLFMYSAFLTGSAPNDGWFNYLPLADKSFTPGPNIDFYALGLIFLGISTTGGAINFIVTALKLRAPGMTLNRIPIFVWGELAMAFQIIFALPMLTLACILLVLQRKFGFHFYDPGGGGDPILWQHLFWIFGHPEVYIVVLPAFGIASAI